jgi:hypothetical protein
VPCRRHFNAAVCEMASLIANVAAVAVPNLSLGSFITPLPIALARCEESFVSELRTSTCVLFVRNSDRAGAPPTYRLLGYVAFSEVETNDGSIGYSESRV